MAKKKIISNIEYPLAYTECFDLKRQKAVCELFKTESGSWFFRVSDKNTMNEFVLSESDLKEIKYLLNNHL